MDSRSISPSPQRSQSPPPKRGESSTISSVSNDVKTGKANSINLPEVVSKMRNPKTGLILKDRRWRLRVFKNSFVGCEAVDWMLRNITMLNTREECVTLGQNLLDRSYFYPVSSAGIFEDKYVFYTFEMTQSAPQDIQKWRKPRIHTLDQVPKHLDTPYYGYFRSKLLSGGFFIVQYNNTGTILLTHIEHQDEPLIITINDDGILQMFNMESGEFERFNQLQDGVKEVQCMWFDDRKWRIILVLKERIIIYPLTEKQDVRLSTEIRKFFNKYDPIKSPESLPSMQTPINRLQGILLPLTNDVGIRGFRKPISINPNHSYLMDGSKILLGSPDFFQVWELSDNNTIKLYYQGDCSTPGTNFLHIYCYRNTVVTTLSNNTMSVWDVNTKTFSSHNLDDNAVVTALFMDDNFLIVGDSNGLVTVRERKNGALIYNLNRKTIGRIKSDAYFNLDCRVNCIERVGRWVMCGLETGMFHIYDLNLQNAEFPAAEYRYPKNGAVKLMIVENNTVYMAIKLKATSGIQPGPMPHIVTWSPSLEGFDFFSMMQSIISNKNVNTHVVVLTHSFTKLTNTLNDVGIIKQQDVREFTTTLDGVQDIIHMLIAYGNDIKVPFLLINDLQKLLDDYEELLQKWSHEGLLSKCFTNNRLRKTLESRNLELYKKVDEVKQILQAMAVAEKKRLGRGREEASKQIAVSPIQIRKNTPNPPPVKETPVVVNNAPTASPTPIRSRTGTSAIKANGSSSLMSSGGASPTIPVKNSVPVKTTTAPIQKTLSSDQLEAVKRPSTSEHQTAESEEETPQEVEEDENGAVVYSKKYDVMTIRKAMENEIESVETQEPAPQIPTPTPTPQPATTPPVTASPPTQPKSTMTAAQRNASKIGPLRDVHPEAKAIWLKFFANNTIVDWEKFIKALQTFIPDKLGPTDERLLQHILDNSGSKFVSVFKVSDFLKSFSPVASCIKNLKEVLSMKWFQGFLTSREAELLLKYEADGTFLVRFSKSRGGSFALAFKHKNIIKHILIYSIKPIGYKIIENQQQKDFKTLQEIIIYYSQHLKIPYSSSLCRERFFQGDLNSEEAASYLKDQAVGSFMIRFSTGGELAASFLDSNKNVRHSLIKQEAGKYVIFSEGQPLHFPSVKELVNHYIKAGVFTTPCSNMSSIFMEEKALVKRPSLITEYKTFG